MCVCMCVRACSNVAAAGISSWCNDVQMGGAKIIVVTPVFTPIAEKDGSQMRLPAPWDMKSLNLAESPAG